MIEPSTPPSNRTGFPNTPSTPRFGIWEDHPQPQQHSFYAKTQLQNSLVYTPTRRKQDVSSLLDSSFLTPKATPQSQRLSGSRAIFGSGRQGRRQQVAGHFVSHPKTPTTPKVRSLALSHNAGRSQTKEHAVYPAPRVFTSTKPAVSFTETVKGREGIWYVFRGKRVFRPLAADLDAPKIEPTTLFKQELQAAKQKDESNWRAQLQPVTLFDKHRESSDSEADTDIEGSNIVGFDP